MEARGGPNRSEVTDSWLCESLLLGKRLPEQRYVWRPLSEARSFAVEWSTWKVGIIFAQAKAMFPIFCCPRLVGSFKTDHLFGCDSVWV